MRQVLNATRSIYRRGFRFDRRHNYKGGEKRYLDAQ